MKLYEIAEEYRRAAVALAEMDMDEQSVADTLEGMAGEFDAKAKAVAAVVAELEAEADMMDRAAKRLMDRQKATQRRADSLKNYLLAQMHTMGKMRIKDAVLPIRVQKNPPRVIVDEDAVPDKYRIARTTWTTDKKGIKALLESGEKVNWARIEQGERVVIG